jgi:hypothetical protein
MCLKTNKKQTKNESIVNETSLNKEGPTILYDNIENNEKIIGSKISSKSKLYYDNGYVYEGEYLNSRKHGFGIYYRRKGDGDMYIGDYSNNLYHGKGFYKWNNGSKLFGDWSMGVLNGTGVVINKNGDKYAGQFLNDQPNGDGIYFYSNGTRYEGQFLSGKKNGPGVIYVKNGKYVCSFENDQVNGNCKYYVRTDDDKYSFDKICVVKLDENGVISYT